MKWLEIIEFRSVDSDRELMKSQLQDLVNEVNRETRHQKIKVYSHITVETDLRIHLIHDSEKVKASGSRLGLDLTSALKEHGLVNHSAWIEMQS
ncbi:MAG: hypothetical protein K8R76_10535 [Candidatus Aegiribacteria sp.]|nr:hypothetical protein [Candidatus Aegiribacteria sp.]